MKRRMLILISVLTVFNLILNGQDTLTIKPWSVSLSYAPKFEIWRPLNPTNDIFFKSFEISVNKKLSQHFSFGVGINYQNLNKYGHSLDLETGIERDIKTNYTYLDFPIQINYHFLNDPKKIDPYVKAAFINSYYHEYFEETGIDYYKSDSYAKYLILWDLGIGSFLKINNRLSIMCQVSLGFGINHYNPQYTFFKSQIGLSYNLTKIKVNS